MGEENAADAGTLQLFLLSHATPQLFSRLEYKKAQEKEIRNTSGLNKQTKTDPNFMNATHKYFSNPKESDPKTTEE